VAVGEEPRGKVEADESGGSGDKAAHR
jgi:hypothetical protein